MTCIFSPYLNYTGMRIILIFLILPVTVFSQISIEGVLKNSITQEVLPNLDFELNGSLYSTDATGSYKIKINPEEKKFIKLRSTALDTRKDQNNVEFAQYHPFDDTLFLENNKDSYRFDIEYEKIGSRCNNYKDTAYYFSKRYIQGKIREAGTNESIPFGEVHIAGSDGWWFVFKADHNGEFKIALTPAVTYQLQANTPMLGHPCDSFARRYYWGTKELISFTEKGVLKKDLFLEVVTVCRIGFPELFKSHQDSTLNTRDSIMLNSFTETLMENPTLSVAINNYNSNPNLNEKLYNYLENKGINPLRIEKEKSSMNPFKIDCYFEWNHKYEYPDLKTETKITSESIKLLTDKSQEFMKKYLNYVSFKIVSSNFKP